MIACLLAAMLTSVAHAQGDKPAGPPPAVVRVSQAKTLTVQRRYELVGRLKEVNRVIVSAEQMGRLVDVKIEVGQPVVGGQTMLVRGEDTYAKLEVADAKAALAEAEATVAETSALLENATRDREYYEQLERSGTAKRKELDDSRTTERAAAARLAAAKARVEVSMVRIERAQTDLAKLTVVAPFDGTVVAKLAELGMWAEKGTPITEIISRGRIDALIDVPERLVNSVHDGQPVEVLIEPLDQSVEGKVQAVIPLGSSAARTFPVKIRMGDLDGALKPGMSVIARVPGGEPAPMLTVPRDAVLRSSRGAVVWVNSNGVAQQAPVRVLFTEGDRYAVETQGPTSPLVDGASVVIEGGERILFPGQPLRVAGPPEAPPAPEVKQPKEATN